MAKRKRIRNEELLKLLAINMRRIRKSQKLTLVELSKLMDVEYVQVANLELGKRDPTLSMLKLIADSLNVTISELLKETTP